LYLSWKRRIHSKTNKSMVDTRRRCAA